MEKPKSSFSKTAYEIMSRNESFLLASFRDVLDEIVELANDAIDYATVYAKQDIDKKSYGNKAMHFYAHHVLLSSSNTVFSTLLLGNVVVCFRELRFMLEMLAKCYLADSHYPDQLFFQDKLTELHNRNNGKRISEIAFIEEFIGKVRIDENIASLWRALSEETHGRRFVNRVVENIVEKNNMPGYALTTPTPYNKEDTDDLDELNNYVKSFRNILSKAINEKSS